jgi:Arrestin (or S-antigen), C-terminal domain
LDLNHEGVEIRKPLRGDISKKFFLGFGSGKLNIFAEIPVRGFVGGQTLDIAVNIVNDTSVAVERIFIELRRMFLFKCTTISTKKDSKVLVSGNHDGVAAKSKGQATFSFVVPPIEPTSVKSCKYIHVTYEIAVTAEVRGVHRSCTLNLPIVIGTIPLTGLEKPTSENLPSSEPPPSYDYAMTSHIEKCKVEEKI